MLYLKKLYLKKLYLKKPYLKKPYLKKPYLKKLYLKKSSGVPGEACELGPRQVGMRAMVTRRQNRGKRRAISRATGLAGAPAIGEQESGPSRNSLTQNRPA